MSWTSIHRFSLSDLILWIYFSCPPYNHKGFDLGILQCSSGFPYLFQFSLNLTIKSPQFNIYCQLQSGTCHGYLPSTSVRMKSCASAATDFQHPLTGVQSREQKWGTLCSENNWHDRFSDRYFQEQILWAQFLYLLIFRKILKSFMGITVPHYTSRNLLGKKNKCLHLLSLHQNHIYTDPLPYLFGAVSQTYLRWCLLGCSPHLAPNKT